MANLEKTDSDGFGSSEYWLKTVWGRPYMMKEVPEDILTPDFCAAVLKDTEARFVSELPKALRKSSFYSALMGKMPDVFWHIPNKNRTASICKQAIQLFGYSSAEEAVKANPKLFCYLHPSLYDYDACMAFVTSSFFQDAIKKRRYSDTDVSGSVTKEAIWFSLGRGMYSRDYSIPASRFLCFPEVCHEAVRANGAILQAIPTEQMTLELCFLAVQDEQYRDNEWDTHPFKYVPIEYMTKDLCELAVASSVRNLEHVPEAFITYDMCLEAVKRDGYLLKYVPDRLKTHEMCSIALKGKHCSWEFVPDRLLDKELARIFVTDPKNTAYYQLGRVPERLRDREICLQAVKLSGSNLKFVPEQVKDYEMCLCAAESSFSSAPFIPHEYFTPEVCLALTRKSVYGFEHIPKDCLTTECCLQAIKHTLVTGETVFSLIPPHLLTQEICDIAVSENVWDYSIVPEQFVTEDMLVYVAKRAPGILATNFPERFKEEESIKKILGRLPPESLAREYVLEQLPSVTGDTN